MTLASEVGSTNMKIVRGACPYDCWDTCAMLYHAVGGALVDVRGDPDHPMTRGGLCVELKNFPSTANRPIACCTVPVCGVWCCSGVI